MKDPLHKALKQRQREIKKNEGIEPSLDEVIERESGLTDLVEEFEEKEGKGDGLENLFSL